MTLLIYLLALIGAIAFMFFSVDWGIGLYKWQSRIHIGRWTDRKVWQQAVEKKARQWLHQSPTVQKTEQDRLVLWDMLRGNYRSSTIQSWQDAGLLLALSEQDAQAYAKRHSSLFAKETWQVDQSLLAYALKKKNALSIDTEKEITERFASYRKDEQTIPYRKTLPHIRFVDTVGLVCPFLHQCGFSDLAIRQIEEYDKGIWEGTFPPHAYDLTTHKPLGVFDWARGCGWYVLGLIEAPDLPGNEQRILNLSNRLLPFQKPDGGFSCMLFNPNERFEASGSALFGLLFVHAYRLSGDKRYLHAAFCVEKALMKATRRDGTIDFAQGDTKGIGFYSRIFDRMPFAQGMGLYLSNTLNQYEKVIG